MSREKTPSRLTGPTGASAGFSLIELMTAVAMVGILSGLAVVFVKPTSYAASANGYAHEIAALFDAVRQRAVASGVRQMVEVTDDEVVHYQATLPGVAPADEWRLVGTLPAAPEVFIAATDTRVHVTPDDGVPSLGAGLPFQVDFSPDGTSTAATIFVQDTYGAVRARVAVYKATGSAYVYSQW
jgi:prepilin-type N-terminal cleavage/methylation domain-containing protein